MPIGLTGFLGIGRESVWGTPVRATRYAPLLSESLDPDIEHVGHDNVLGLGVSQQQSPVSGLRSIAGELVFQSRPAFLGDALRMIAGTAVSTPMTTKTSGAIQINVDAAAGTFTRLSGSFLTDGFVAGMPIKTSGFSNAGNNTNTKVILTVTALVITVSDKSGLVNETGSGDEVIVGGSTSHVYKPRNLPFAEEVWGAPYTVEVFKGVGNESHQFAGVVADTLEFRWGARERLLTVSMSVIGKLMPVFITKTTPLVEDTLPFAWNQCQITLPEPTVFKQFSDLTLRMSWGLRSESLIDGTSVIGVIQPDQLFSVELTGTAFPFTTTEFTEFVNQSERTSIITFDSGVNILGTTDKYLLRFKLPKLRYSVNRYGLRGVGLIQAEITARAFYDASDAASIVTTLQNGVREYE